MTESARSFKVLSFNIQAGTTTLKYRDYLTKSWRQVLPHQQRMGNLDQIAQLLSNYDIAGLQELDDGSLRSGFVNQTQYLAERGGFPYWSHQPNRAVSKLARTCNGLLTRLKPREVHDHKLPGRVPGRGALAAYYDLPEGELAVIVVHLALGSRSRRLQLQFLDELIDRPNVVLMGDMNAPLQSSEIAAFMDRNALRSAVNGQHTFPSWRPQRAIDHVLVSDGVRVESGEVLNVALSDHLPIALELSIA